MKRYCCCGVWESKLILSGSCLWETPMEPIPWSIRASMPELNAAQLFGSTLFYHYGHAAESRRCENTSHARFMLARDGAFAILSLFFLWIDLGQLGWRYARHHKGCLSLCGYAVSGQQEWASGNYPSAQFDMQRFVAQTSTQQVSYSRIDRAVNYISRGEYMDALNLLNQARWS